jgi:DNA-binding MarR family transcriptional regulator
MSSGAGGSRTVSVAGTDDARLPRPLADLVSRVAHRLTREREQVLATIDLTVDQWRVLVLLSDGAGHPMTAIAEHAMVPAPTLTKIVDWHTDSALVSRRPDRIDRRRVLVLLSELGRTVYDENLSRVTAAEGRVTDALDAAERAQLRHLLERLAD